MSESNKITKKQLVKASFVLVASILITLVFLGIIAILTYSWVKSSTTNPDIEIAWTDVVGGILSIWSFFITVYLGWKAFIGACKTIHKHRKTRKAAIKAAIANNLL